MLTYALVLLAVIAVLWISFRALGAGVDPLSPESYRDILARIASGAAERAAEVDAVLTAPAPAAGDRDGAAEVAAAARKQLSGWQQRLMALERTADGGDEERLDAARALLSAALEDLGWACRMLESGGHRTNPGVRAAAEELVGHGRECLEALGPLVGEPAAATPALHG